MKWQCSFQMAIRTRVIHRNSSRPNGVRRQTDRRVHQTCTIYTTVQTVTLEQIWNYGSETCKYAKITLVIYLSTVFLSSVTCTTSYTIHLRHYLALVVHAAQQSAALQSHYIYKQLQGSISTQHKQLTNLNLTIKFWIKSQLCHILEEMLIITHGKVPSHCNT